MVDIRKIMNVDPAEASEKIETKQEEQPIKYAQVEREQAAARKAEEYAAKLAEAGAKSQFLRADINKAVKEGAEPVEILLKALECISLMTGDTVVYRQNERILREKYK